MRQSWIFLFSLALFLQIGCGESKPQETAALLERGPRRIDQETLKREVVRMSELLFELQDGQIIADGFEVDYGLGGFILVGGLHTDRVSFRRDLVPRPAAFGDAIDVEGAIQLAETRLRRVLPDGLEILGSFAQIEVHGLEEFWVVRVQLGRHGLPFVDRPSSVRVQITKRGLIESFEFGGPFPQVEALKTKISESEAVEFAWRVAGAGPEQKSAIRDGYMLLPGGRYGVVTRVDFPSAWRMVNGKRVETLVEYPSMWGWTSQIVVDRSTGLWERRRGDISGVMFLLGRDQGVQSWLFEDALRRG